MRRRSLSQLDAGAFKRAFHQHGEKVFRYAYSRLGPDHADEVLSETFAVAWKIREKFVDPSNNGLEAWLIGIATKVIAGHRRQEMRWLQMSADSATFDATDFGVVDEAVDRADAETRSERVGHALAQLPERERVPLLLHVVHELSYEEIARALHVPVGTVRSRISRGRQRVAARLDEKGGARGNG